MKLRDRIKKHGKVEYKHIGAMCPSCGYIFKKGFGDVTRAVLKDENAPMTSRTGKAFSLCSGCFAPIRVDVATGEIEVISAAEMVLWPRAMHEKIKEVTAFMKEHKASLPS